MNIEKTSITLFDIVGYILPGFVLIIAISILVSSICDGYLLYLSDLNSNWIIVTIAAYFLGQLSHRIGSWIKIRKPNWFRSRSMGLSDHLYYHVRNSLVRACNIELEDDQKITTLETYILAESIVVAKGRTEERDSLLAREGFHKTSMTAFAFFTLIFLLVTMFGGAIISISPGVIIETNIWQSTLFTVISFVFAIVFRQGFVFYNRLKITNILLLALTLLDDNKEEM